MIAVLIFAISVVTLLEFFVSYSRSVIAASRTHELSEETCEICGFTPRTVGGNHFWRLLQLIALCPEASDHAIDMRVVTLYFRLLGLARALFGWAAVSAAPWIDDERGGCAYAAAVVLDRRIAYNRMMMAQQINH